MKNIHRCCYWIYLVVGISQTLHSFAGAPNSLPKGLPKSLKDAYLAALQQSDTLGVQKELTIQANDVLDQANGALLPTVSGSLVHIQQPASTSSTGSAIYPTEQTTAKITADQPLFRGLRDFAALRQKKYLVGVQFNSYLAAARQLFYDLATAYYNVQAYADDIKNYKIEIEVNQRRLKELEEFYRIGRSQLTDVLTFKSNILSLESQLEATQGQLEVAKNTLAYLTGWKKDFVLSDDETPSLEPGDISPYLTKIEDRPEVKSALENLRANEEGIPIAFGQHYPTVDLIGDYYLSRPGVLSNVNWDVQLSLSLPIFQGGIIQSQVRQAHSVVSQYEHLLSDARRSAEKEIRTFYDQVLADGRQLKKLQNLVEISKQNSETEVRYFRNGLVTNLDVLTAINTHQDARRQLDHQLQILKMDSVKLKAATGQRSEIVVKPPEH